MHVIGPDWISQHQLAKQLKRSLDTLQRWRKLRKSPPFAKLGSEVYYRRQDVDEWLKARAAESCLNPKPRIEIIPRQRNARQRNARRAAK